MPSKRLRTGEDIRKERTRLGLSQEAAAHLLGVALATLSRWERGVVEPSPLVLRGVEGIFADFQKSKKERR